MPQATPDRECAELFWNHHQDRLLPVLGAKERELWVRNPAGLWEPAEGGPIHHAVDSALAAFMPEHTHHQINTARKEVLRYACMRSQIRRLSEMDAQLRYLAAPNGVIDLTGGRLVPAGRAPGLLVTTRRMVADPFEPDADETDEAAEWLAKLFAWTDPEAMEWVLASLGFALHGDPAKRIHVLTGPTGAGKTTIVQAAVHALGGYGAKGRPESINTRGRTSGFEDAGVWFDGPRIAVFDELDGVHLNASKLKDYSSGGIGTKEVKFSSPDHTARITATAFLACNDDQVRSMGAEQQAMSDRLHLLRLKPIPEDEQDRAVPQMFQHWPPARSGMLARLVKAAAANHRAPTAPASVGIERQRRIEDDLGIVGTWLQEHVIVDHGQEVLTLDGILKAMRHDPDGAVSETARALTPQKFGGMIPRYVPAWDSLPKGRKNNARGKTGARLSESATLSLRVADRRMEEAFGVQPHG